MNGHEHMGAGGTQPGTQDDVPDGARRGSPDSSNRWLSAALQAWDDTRDALMDFDRAIISAQPDPSQVPRSVRNALAALRRADATRPAWVQISTPAERMTRGHGLSGYELGDEPRASTWTERQLQRTRDAARRLRAELERAQAQLRTVRRDQPAQSWGAQVAETAEATVTAILRPLSLAVATTTGPLQRGFGQGAGLGLAAAAVIAAFVLLK
jgi:hypothetical protein